MENSCGADPQIHAEHGLSFYVETEKHKLLVDTGQSDLTWENAGWLGVDLSSVDLAILSHGHYDHSGGLLTFAARYPGVPIWLKDSAGGPYYSRKTGREEYIGIDQRLLALPQLHFTAGDCQIDEELSLYSDVTGRILWPAGNRVLLRKVGAHTETLPMAQFGAGDCCVSQTESECLEQNIMADICISRAQSGTEKIYGKREQSGTEKISDGCEQSSIGKMSNDREQNGTEDVSGDAVYVQDDFAHEQYLVIRQRQDYYLFSGCAHNGIINILARFREIYGCDPKAVFSGFHMMKNGLYEDEDIARVRQTAEILAGSSTHFYTGHCTGEEAYGIMKEILGPQLHHLHAGDIFDI